MAPVNAPRIQPRILIIGIGNDHRHDDAAGLIAVRRLRARQLPRVAIFEASAEGTALMNLWQDAETVIFIDAVESSAPPGTIHRFDAQTQPLPRTIFCCSTHAFGLAEAVELARALDRLPSRLLVFGIEGRDFAQGSGLSPEVENALPTLLKTVTRELESL